jgi:hypothetical protein
MNFLGPLTHSRQSIVARSLSLFCHAVETDPLIPDVCPEDILEVNIYRDSGALGVDTGVANRLKTDQKYVTTDAGMEWSWSLMRTDEDNVGAEGYLIDCGSQSVFNVFISDFFTKDVEDSSRFFISSSQPIFQEPKDPSCLQHTCYRFRRVFGNQVTPLQSLQQSVV